MREISGKTRTSGLIGNPVEHTMSPMIHNFLAEELEMDMAYVPFYVEKGQLDAAVKGAYGLNILGCNGRRSPDRGSWAYSCHPARSRRRYAQRAHRTRRKASAFHILFS